MDTEELPPLPDAFYLLCDRLDEEEAQERRKQEEEQTA